MVVVMPGLAEGRDGEPEDIGRVVVDVKAAGAREVADGVDAPGDVVDEEDPDEATPEQAQGRAGDGAGDQVSGDRGNSQPEGDEPDEVAVDQPHAWVLVKVGRVALPVGAAVLGEE